MKTCVVVPTYNEAENIERLLRAIADLGIEGLDVLVVDDGSPDGTGDIVERLKKELTVDILHRSSKQGLGSAYRAGFDKAILSGAEYIFEMDADFSHDPNDIPRLLKEAEKGADLVIGSRKIKGGKVIGWNLWRHTCSNGAMLTSRIVLGLKTKDLTAGFRCFRTTALKLIDYSNVKSNGYAFQEEMLFRVEKKGLKVVEVPVIFPDREKGQSKLGFGDIVEFFKTIVILRFKK